MGLTAAKGMEYILCIILVSINKGAKMAFDLFLAAAVDDEIFG